MEQGLNYSIAKEIRKRKRITKKKNTRRKNFVPKPKRVHFDNEHVEDYGDMLREKFLRQHDPHDPDYYR